MMYAQTLSWDTWDADIIRWFNNGFNGATSQEAGNFVLMICSLLLTVILTGALGFEREYRGHHAGLRTHVLVGVGSCLIMMISIYGFTPWDEAFVTGAATRSGAPAARDPTRLAAQVVSGIGFLGAGTIIFQKNVVRGLTTAAGLWVTAAIGLACGTGMFVAAVITTAMVLLGLEVLNYLIPQLGTTTIELSFTAPSIDSVKQLIQSLKQDNVEIHSYELKDRRTSKGEFLEVSMELKAKRGFHTLCMLDYMNDFSDVTISTME